MRKIKVATIVKLWEGKRKPGKKEHKWAPTIYLFESEFAAQQAFFEVRMNYPKKELFQAGKELTVYI